MVKRKFLWQLLALATVLFTSCSTSDTDEETPELPPIPEEELVVNGEMKDLLITGFVHDTDGEPLAGVTVISGTSVMQTNSSGMFTFSSIDMVRNRSVVRFKKEGYFDVVRSFKSSDGDSWEVVMCSKGNGSFMSSTTYSSNTSENIKAGGLKIEMPANGYVVDATGSGFAGKVKADVVYLDPNNENFQAMMPGGDLAAVRADGSDAMLVSYGMTGVNLTDEAGNKLQLKPGNTAKLTFPVPEGMEENLPASIPLWSFNEKTGLWEEEGAATLQGEVYVGEVKHFSWVNLDYPEEQAKVKGYVRNANGKPLANIRVTVGQVATSALTNTEGYYEQEVPAEVAFEITVKAKHYGNYKNIFAVPVRALDKKEERTVNITLPTLHTLSGRIVNQGAGTNIASVWLQYGSRKTNSVSSGKDGVFSMYQPEGYTGNAVLMVQTSDGDIVTREITIGNSDMNVGDIIINSATGAGGVLSLKLSDGTDASFSISDASETSMGGVVVADGSLMFMGDEDESELSGNEFFLQVDGYDSSKGSYENGSVFASDKKQQFVCEGAAKVNVSRNGSKFVFSLSGKGMYYNSITSKVDQNVAFSSEGLALSLFMVGKTLHNIIPSKSGFPSFTPELSVPSPMAFLISECKLAEKCGVVCYNGTLNDYKTLKEAAAKSGIKLISEEDYGDGKECLYFSNGKCIVIEYDSEARKINDKTNFLEQDDCPLSVTVYEGIREGIDIFFSSERRYAKKLSSMRKNNKRLSARHSHQGGGR